MRPNPVLRDLGLQTDERGAVSVDSMLRVEGRDGLWALGDCARVPNERTPGQPIPRPRSTLCARPAASPRICRET